MKTLNGLNIEPSEHDADLIVDLDERLVRMRVAITDVLPLRPAELAALDAAIAAIHSTVGGAIVREMLNEARDQKNETERKKLARYEARNVKRREAKAASIRGSTVVGLHLVGGGGR